MSVVDLVKKSVFTHYYHAIRQSFFYSTATIVAAFGVSPIVITRKKITIKKNSSKRDCTLRSYDEPYTLVIVLF